MNEMNIFGRRRCAACAGVRQTCMCCVLAWQQHGLQGGHSVGGQRLLWAKQRLGFRAHNHLIASWKSHRGYSAKHHRRENHHHCRSSHSRTSVANPLRQHSSPPFEMVRHCAHIAFLPLPSPCSATISHFGPPSTSAAACQQSESARGASRRGSSWANRLHSTLPQQHLSSVATDWKS